MAMIGRSPASRVALGGLILLAGVAVSYGLFALLAGVGLVEAHRSRVLPWVFVVHAIGGGAVLVLGAVQTVLAALTRPGRWHRVAGRAYVVAICAAALAGIASALVFDVSAAARVSFLCLGVLWIMTTLIGLARIRAGQMTRHRAWMIRSYALALFFVSFTFWVPVLTDGTRGPEPWYTAAVTLSWALNLLLAEALIRVVWRRSGGATLASGLQASR